MPQAPCCTLVPESTGLAHACVSIPLIYCCRANAYRVLLAEKSSGEPQEVCRNNKGIGCQLQGQAEHPQPWVPLPCPARKHAQPVGRALQRARGWGGLDLLCIIAQSAWGLGGSWQRCAMQGSGQRCGQTLAAGGQGSGAAPSSVGCCAGGAGLSCSLLSCTSTMNRHRRQCLCCRNQYCSRSGLGAPPCAPVGAIPSVSPSAIAAASFAAAWLSSTEQHPAAQG